MEVYLDILFLMNFIPDLLIMKTTCEIMSVKVSFLRLFSASVIGGLAGVLFFSIPYAVLYPVLLSFCMSVICCYPCKMSVIIKTSAMIFVLSSFFSGVIFTDMMLFGGGMIKNGIFYTSSPRIIFISAGIYILSKLLLSRLRRRAVKKNSRVTLEYAGKIVHTTALTDTGNGLYDPISHMPVILIELEILKKLTDPNCTTANISEWIQKDRIKIIPYRTIDKSGYLTGLKLDRIYIDGRCVEGAIAAVCGQKLSQPVILHSGI